MTYLLKATAAWFSIITEKFHENTNATSLKNDKLVYDTAAVT